VHKRGENVGGGWAVGRETQSSPAVAKKLPSAMCALSSKGEKWYKIGKKDRKKEK